MSQDAVAPWDLDRLSPELLEATYRELERFVAWLRSLGIEVPDCWYVHPWSAHRLAAVMHWRREDLFHHGDHHFEAGRQEPTPSLDQVIDRLLDQARRRLA